MGILWLTQLLLLAGYCLTFSAGFVTISSSSRAAPLASNTCLSSSFFGDFESFDQDDEDEDEDEDEYDLGDSKLDDFRSRMENLFGGGGDSTSAEQDVYKQSEKPSPEVDQLLRKVQSQQASSQDWAKPLNEVKEGVVLMANPAKFCTDFGSSSSPSASLLNKFGLTVPPPADLGPDRRADLLPVLCVVDRHPLRGSQAVLLNRRTGYLLGDLEQQQSDDMPAPPPRLGAFMIQPLWFGGTSAGGGDESSSGLDMLHQCSAVSGARQLTDDGLYWGGDPAQAQEALGDASLDRLYTGFDFKFFVQSTRWLPLQLEREVKDGTWFCAHVSKSVLFKPRDRMGTRRAKPLWTEIMELMGGDYVKIRDQLYADDAPFP
jgi:hypothetical protein